MKIEKIPISKLNPAVYNPREDLQPGDERYGRIKKSLDRFGLVELLVWNKRSGNLVSGHQRLKILRDAGETTVQVSVVDLNESDEKSLNIALNKPFGDWDMPKLKDLLQELDTGAVDMESIGFAEKELEDLMTQFHPDGADESKTGPVMGGLEYRIIIKCANEAQQLSLLNRFQEEGIECQALIS